MNVNKSGRKSLDKLGRDARVSEIFHDSDGLWLYTATGFCCDPECHTIHGDNVRDVLEQARNIGPCACEQCVNSAGVFADLAKENGNG